MLEFFKKISEETPISKMVGVSKRSRKYPKFSKIEVLDTFEDSKVLVKPHYVGSNFVLRYDEYGCLEGLDEPLMVLFERFNNFEFLANIKVLVKITIPLNIFYSFYSNFENLETLVDGILDCSDVSEMLTYREHIVVKEVYFDRGDVNNEVDDKYRDMDEYLDFMENFSEVFENEEWEVKVYEGQKTLDKMVEKCNVSEFLIDGLIFLNAVNKKINFYSFESIEKVEEVKKIERVEEVEDVSKLSDSSNPSNLSDSSEPSNPFDDEVAKLVEESEESEESEEPEEPETAVSPFDFEYSGRFSKSPFNSNIQDSPDNLGVTLLSPTITEEVVFDDLFGDFKEDEEETQYYFDDVERKEYFEKFERDCKFLGLKLNERDVNNLLNNGVVDICKMFEVGVGKVESILGRSVELKKVKMSFEKFIEFADLRGFNKLRISKICENCKNVYELLECSVEQMVLWLGESDRVVRSLWKALARSEREIVRKLELVEKNDWNLKKEL